MRSRDLQGQRLLLVFVPWAFSPVCTYEIEQLRDASDIRGAVDQILIVNCDSIYVNQEWAEQNNYDDVLLSDFWPHGQVASAYGVFNEDRGQARRGTFLIDAEGTVEWVLENPDGSPRDLQLYREALGVAP